MNTTDLEDLRCFVAIYQAGSFTSGAKKLNISKVAVAKRLTHFEKKLKYRLFRRSTRALSPTPEADMLYGHALQLLQQVQEFENHVTNVSPMEGTVRVTCSYSMAISFVGELLANFQKQHPGLKIELISTDSVLDLIEHNIDLAFRVGNVTAQSMVGKKLGPNELLLCASPEYLKNSPPLKSPADIKNHTLFCMNYHLNAKFQKSGQMLKDVMGAPCLHTNEGELVKKLGVIGQGLIVRSRWSIRDEIKKGTLVEALPKHPLEKHSDIWLISSVGRMQSARIRAVFEMFIEQMKTYL